MIHNDAEACAVALHRMADYELDPPLHRRIHELGERKVLRSALQVGEDAARFVPGPALRRCNDRAEGHVEAWSAAMLSGFAEDPLHRRSHSRARLAEERVDVAMLGADVHCGIGGAAKVERDVRSLRGPHLGESFSDVVEASLEVERFLRYPYPTQNF